MHGERWGSGLSHGKAAYVTIDPGKEALVGVIAALKILRDRPEVITKPMNQLYQIVVEEFEGIDPKIREGLVISKSPNNGGVEINYQNTWKQNAMGFPIFTIEDMYAGSELIMQCLIRMGLVPTISYDGNIPISPGLGTLDADGNLIDEYMRYTVKAIVRSFEIVGRYSKFLD